MVMEEEVTSLAGERHQWDKTMRELSTRDYIEPGAD